MFINIIYSTLSVILFLPILIIIFCLMPFIYLLLYFFAKSNEGGIDDYHQGKRMR